MWFLRFPDRLDQEMQAVNALMHEGWVTQVSWRLTMEDAELCADVTFQGGGKTRQVRLVYPHVYPYAPARVFPSDNARWSSHQWPSGELCLQLRADTWRANFTGGDLLKSTRLLLDTEAQTDDQGRPRRAESAHNFTAGQLLASTYFRLVVPDDVIAELRRRGKGTWKVSLHSTFFESSSVIMAVALKAFDDSDSWTSVSAPPTFAEFWSGNGRIALIEEGDDLHNALTAKNIKPADLWAKFSNDPLDGVATVIGVLTDTVIARYIGSEKVWDMAKIAMDNQSRSPSRNNVLKGKRVAIVGCGSMGSKVATSLARSGVEDFVLLDEDVLKDGNLVRHDLDWSAVGAHKVDALRKRIHLIKPQATVTTRVIRLGGQNSTTFLLQCLDILAGCNLIVEVTGSAQGFSYAGAVAAQHRVPMVWGRVFAGGYGGMVARSRPGLDPNPHETRTLIDIWCANPEFPDPPAAADIDYGAEADDQPAMIADDGDVSVISAHLTRMATDTLRPPTETDYPYSAYMIGLRKEWIFTQPYEAHPVDLAESMAKVPRKAWATGDGAGAADGGSVLRQFPPAPHPRKKWLKWF